MRKFAYLKEPVPAGDTEAVCKIMLYQAEEGFYLFLYNHPDAVQCTADLFFEQEDDIHEEWDEQIDERGWIDLDDPLPDCQTDAFIPLRVKGRNAGKPEWGEYETLQDGKWIRYIPE